MATTHPLVDRIATLRRRVRLLLGLLGAGFVLAAILAAGLALALMDYLVHFSGSSRVVLLVLTALGVLWVGWRTLWQPLSRQLTDRFLASRVELMAGNLSDELISAVQFVDTGLPAQNALAARVVEETEARTQGMDFTKSLDWRPTYKAIGFTLALLIACGIFMAAAPASARIARQRWLHPFGGTEWPKITTVAWDWSGLTGTENQPPSVWPEGEPLALRAKVTEGYNTGLRVWLYNSSDTQRESSDLMTLQPSRSSKHAGVYEKVIEPSGKELSLRLEAGDDTEQPPVAIRLAARPQIKRILARIVPPAYVKGEGKAAQVDLLTQAGRAVEGSTIQLLIESSKPLAGEGGTLAIQLVDPVKGTPLDVAVTIAPGNSGGTPSTLDNGIAAATNVTANAVSPASRGASTATLTFSAVKTLQARVVIRDTDGLDNRIGGQFSMEVVPDALPTVLITEPRRTVEVQPEARVNLAVLANDDLGIADLLLRADNFDGKPAATPEDPGARFSIPLTFSAAEATGGVAVKSTYAWDLALLALKPGDRLSFYAMVRDNYNLPDRTPPRHPWVRSAALTLQIRSLEQVAENLRRDLQSMREQIRQLAAQQDQTRLQTQAIQKAVQESGTSTQQQKEQLAELRHQQDMEAQRANAIAQQLQQMADGAKQNKIDNTDLGQLAKEAAQGMKQVGEQPMPKAATELNNAERNAGKPQKESAEKTAEAAAKAGEQQQQAMDTMQALVDKLGATGDFEALRSATAKALDDQKNLQKDLREVARQTVGQDPKNLPKEIKERLEKLARDQSGLGKQVESLTQRMEKTAEGMQQRDPASSESLKSAAEASKKNNVSGSMQEASSSAGNNQMQNASSSQQQAQRGLEKMLEELDQQNRRQLEQLARQLEKLIDQVKELLAKQTAINTDTAAAGAQASKDALLPLGDRQGRLQQNTLVISGQAEATKDGRPVAADLRNAAGVMGDAAGPLYKGTQPPAIEPQGKAIAALNAALKKLEEQLKKTQEKMQEENLAALQKQYEAILKNQTDIKAISDAAERLKQARGELLRPQAAKVIEQAGTQGKLAEQVTGLSEKLKESPVIVWVNEQIIEKMGASKERLARAEVGTELAENQQTAIDRLKDVIAAIQEERKNPSPFNSGGGGGGGSGGGKQPLVPPVAQLKLLKAMQTLVNTRTKALDDQIQKIGDAGQRSTMAEKAVELSRTQEQIRKMAQEVVESLGQ